MKPSRMAAIGAGLTAVAAGLAAVGFVRAFADAVEVDERIRYARMVGMTDVDVDQMMNRAAARMAGSSLGVGAALDEQIHRWLYASAETAFVDQTMGERQR